MIKKKKNLAQVGVDTPNGKEKHTLNAVCLGCIYEYVRTTSKGTIK